MTCRPGMFQLILTALLPITLQLHVLFELPPIYPGKRGTELCVVYVLRTPYKEFLGTDRLSDRGSTETSLSLPNHVGQSGCTQFPHESGCFSVISTPLQ
jgi:hypothetical protein